MPSRYNSNQTCTCNLIVELNEIWMLFSYYIFYWIKKYKENWDESISISKYENKIKKIHI